MDKKEILQMLGKPERLETGLYCSLLLNTKGGGCPFYLLNYLTQITRDSLFLFDVRMIFDATPQLEYWKEEYPKEVKDEDTLLQIVCTLNLDETTGDDFEWYMQLFIEDDIIPFVVGCKFDFMGMFFIYQTPPEYKELARGGEHSVILHSKEIGSALFGILKDIFLVDESKMATVDEYFNMIGWYRFENCISKENLPKLEAWMKKLGLKYEIE